MPYATITEIQAANRALNRYWFDRESNPETEIIGGHYWVESRPRRDSSARPGDRWYAAVRADDDGSVSYLDSSRCSLESLDEALADITAVLG
ncbi:hypothetical protein [Gordonia sihwensis]|uniref:hypothetical protein n=1 Tax=Gordonia sihwensis TaxID=173559 RepID=UPI003D953212